MKEIAVSFAENCAWRAAYLYVDGRQVAHIGVDPNHGVRPTLFLKVGRDNFRYNLPRVPWRMDAGPVYLHLYKLAATFWHNVDGRIGWGAKDRNRRV